MSSDAFSGHRLGTRITLACVLAWIIALLPTPVHSAQEAFRGVAFDETLSGEAVLADALRTTQMSPVGLSLNVRLVVERAELERQPDEYDFSALDARMARHTALRGVATYVDLRDLVPTLETLDSWDRFVRAVASRYRGVVRGYIFGVLPPSAPRPLSREYAFYVKSTAISLRAGDESAATVLGGVADAGWIESLYEEDVAPYVDVIGLEAKDTNAAGVAEILAVIEQHDPNSGVVRLGEPLGEDPSEGPRRFLQRHFDILGTRISAVSYSAPAPVVAAVLSPVSSLRGILNQELVSLDETVMGLRLTHANSDVTALVPHKLLFGLSNSVNYFVYASPEPDGSLDLVLSERTGTRPMIIDALRNTRRPAPSFDYDVSTRIARIEIPGGPWPLVVDWSTGESPDYSSREDVLSAVLPSVAEIISRHQQAQAIQDGLLRSYVADATMEQHFRTASAGPDFDVTTENRFFVEGKDSEWEELSFRLNGTRWGSNRPAFPLLQAEKVLSLPFDLRLTADYRYRLVGVEDVDSRTCFVVRFEPVDEQRSLYRGTVWIDRETYLKAKTQTLQAQLSPPIVSSEEIQYFSTVGDIAGRGIRLLTELVGRQIILVAGRNLLVERGVRFERFKLNAPDFAALREASRASESVMYRDTDEGLRYLIKRDGVRVVQDPTTTATAALIGITYDPAYDYPLPLGGINYLDFDFLGQDNQLALIFGGVLTLLNVQRPRLIGEHVDGSLDLFAILIKGSDRTYDSDGELTGQRLLTLPFSTGINVGWQFAEFHKLVGSYQFRYDAFSRDDETAATFQPPPSTATNGVGLSWEWKRAGYSLSAGGASYRRVRWEPWGEPGDYYPTDQDYLKYSASLTKDFYFGLHKIHLNVAYHGGKDLDRFSKYQFGFFDDNRIQGVPSSGVRFGELAMVRGAYSFSLFDQYGFDLFLDQAFGRDRRPASEWGSVTGMGVGVNIPGPRNTLLRTDIGKSLLPSRYRHPGSLVFQIQILKPL